MNVCLNDYKDANQVIERADVCMCIYIYECIMYVCVCMYVCMLVSMYVLCMYVCKYVYMYLCIMQ